MSTNKTNLKVLVCGGRDYSDKDKVFDVLSKIHSKYNIERIIHGDAAGADTLGRLWAVENEIIREEHPAKWKTFKKEGKLVASAGPIRNQEMFDKSKPDLVVAFPGSRGTEGMINIAKNGNVTVHKVDK